MTALMSPAADRFLTALVYGGPILAVVVVAALLALWAAGLVEMSRRADVTYTGTPDADTQLARADVAKTRRVEAERRVRGEVA